MFAIKLLLSNIHVKHPYESDEAEQQRLKKKIYQASAIICADFSSKEKFIMY